MESLFYAPCITGLETIATDALKAALPDAQIERVGEGFVLFKTASTHDALRKLRFLNAVYAVLSMHELEAGTDAVKMLAIAAREDLELEERLHQALPKGGTFAVWAFVANQPASIPHYALEKLEKRIGSAGKFSVDKQEPRWRFSLIIRSEGFGFLGVRLTPADPPLPKGALRPELCHLLCLLSEPKDSDVFLDPFCGSGAIALERAAMAPAAKIWAGDSDATLVKALQSKVTEQKLSITAMTMDALSLEGISDHAVSVIVTDPPWGIYEQTSPDLHTLLHTFKRVLAPGGRLILLLSRAIALQNSLIVESGFTEYKKEQMLVSGQKATVWVLHA